MENNKDNLSNFLRKKFSEHDESDSSWGRPDREVRANVLGQISTPVKNNPISQNLFWKAAFIIALLLTGGYIWHLQTENKKINQQAEEQNSRIEKLESAYLNQLKKQEDKIAELTIEKEKLIIEKKEAEVQIKNTIKKIKAERRSNSQLSDKIRQLKNKAANTTENNQEIKTEAKQPIAYKEGTINNISIIDIVKTVYPIALNQYISQTSTLNKEENLEEQNESIEPESQPIIDPIKKEHQRFEAGYEYALTSYDIPVERKFERQRPFTKNAENSKVKVHSHGAYFSFSPKKNWWIRTGIRTANLDIRREYDMALIYDKEKEMPDPDGGTSNQLALTTSTPYTETESSFNVRFEEGKELEDGDFLKLTINDSQRFNYSQVPVGIEYFYGTGKLQWLFQGGLQWNRIEVGEYSFDVSSEGRKGAAIIERKEVISKNIPAKNFLGTYAGLGLDYHLFNNFHVRASFNVNHNFNKNNKSDFSNSSKTGTAFRLGLNYRF